MAKNKPSRSNTADEFEKLAGGDKYKKAWKSARKVEGGNSFSSPKAPDGRYTARITSAKAGVTQKKELFILIATVITEGEQQGLKVDHYNSLEPERMEWAVKAVKNLGYEFEDDSASPADMKEIMEDLNKTKPIIQISCKNKTVEKVDPQTKKKSKQEVCNWYIDRMLNENPPPMESGSGGGDGDDTIEKGCAVTYKQNGSSDEYQVVAVNEKKGTADIKLGRKTLKGIPLGDLELVYEE